MKIKTEDHGTNVWEGRTWTAIDDDSYDGPGSPVGWGRTERDAIDDLVEQIVEELEERLDMLRHETTCLRAELAGETERTVRALNRANMDRLNPKPPETSHDVDRGGVFLTPSAVPTLPGDCEVTTGLPDDCIDSDGRFMGRLPDEKEWHSDEPEERI